MKIFVYSSHNFEKSFLEKEAIGKHEMTSTPYALDINTVKLAKGFQAILVFTSDDVSTNVLDKLYEFEIKYIAIRAVGHDNIDLNWAKKLGIKVANVPAYSPYAVAEHSVALLMALNRKIVLGQKLMKKNNFSLDQLVGFDLHGKTIGIVGTGKIGSAFANIMKGFGCKLLAFDLHQNKELISQTDIVYKSIFDLCKESDVISINCPLTVLTKYLFDKSLFSIMKKGVYFINTARGGIVNTVDLIEAIENGTIAAAGLDVYENEKQIVFRNHNNVVIIDAVFEELRSLPNVLFTGHQAFLTNEALTGIAITTFKNINDWESKGESENDL